MLAGCNNAPPNEDKPQQFSFSESVQSASESETPAGKESKEVETTPEAVQESEPEKQEETTETDTVSTEQPQTVSESGQAAQPAEQPDKADKTELLWSSIFVTFRSKNSLCMSCFKWRLPTIIRMGTDMIIPYAHISPDCFIQTFRTGKTVRID